jgi:hypothetical protein
VKQATKEVSSIHAAPVSLADDRQSGGWVRCLALQPPVCPVPVVVLDVDPEDLPQVTTADDQQPVEALGAHRTNPPLRVGVRVRRLHRRHEHVDTLRLKHVIEPAAELRVSIANEEAHPASSFVQGQQQVAGLLGNPGAVGVGRHAGQVVVVGRGVGSSPWRRSVVRIAVAETCMPSCWSSPWMRW